MSTTISDASLSSDLPSSRPDAPQGSGFHPPAPSGPTAAHEENARQFEAAMHSADQNPDNQNSSSRKPEKNDSTSPSSLKSSPFKDGETKRKPETRKVHEEKEREERDQQQEKLKSEKMPLESLFAGRFDAGAASRLVRAEATSPVEPSPCAEALAEHLTERILVSEPSAAGQEVRIQPSRDILPDTEICLMRGADGLLSAVIRTDNPAAFQTLAAAQHDLRTRLEQSEGQAVRVELRSSADDDNDPSRRSRGLDLIPNPE